MNEIAELLGHIRRGNAAAAAQVLAANPDLANARDDKGDSPVLVATYHGKQDLVRLPLERGARPTFFEACALGLDADVGRELRDNPSAVRQVAHDGWRPFISRPSSAIGRPSRRCSTRERTCSRSRGTARATWRSTPPPPGRARSGARPSCGF